jgi:glycosyltransferase involved in cell wall biosynthesis
LVSIVIPAYNAADTIGAQLSALANQTFRGHFEVVVVNNGSTDPTEAVVARHQHMFRDLKLIRAPEVRSPAHARNAGAQYCRGTLLLFCDADDLVTPNWVESMAALLAENDLAGGTLEHHRLTPPAVRSWFPSRTDFTEHEFLPYTASANLGIRTAAFRQIGGFSTDLRTGEDKDLCWRAQLAGYSFVLSRDAVVHYRQRAHLGSMLRAHFRNGLGQPQIYRAYRKYGMKANPKMALRFWLSFLGRLPFILAGPRRQARWLRRAAVHTGRLVSSIRYRVFYP